MPAVGRAQLLRMEAELAEKEEALAEMKASLERCSECGRVLPQKGKPKGIQKKLADAKIELRAARQAFREARG